MTTVRAALLLSLLVGAGCFPYRQVYRRAFSGVVVDGAGQPVSGAAVVACSVNGWGEKPATCPRWAARRTDEAGRFSLPRYREWEWCCLGEAPRPATFVSVCAPERGHVTGTGLQPIDLGPAGDVRLTVPAAAPDAVEFYCASALGH